jgi:hypothetical protein
MNPSRWLLAALLSLCLAAEPALATVVRVSGNLGRTGGTYPAVLTPMAQAMGQGLSAAFPGGALSQTKLGPVLPAILNVKSGDINAAQAYAPLAHQMTQVFGYTPETLAAKAQSNPQDLAVEMRLALEEAESQVIEATYQTVAEMTPLMHQALDDAQFKEFASLVDRLNSIERRYPAYFARGAMEENSNLAYLRQYAEQGRERVAKLRRERTMAVAGSMAEAVQDGAFKPQDIQVSVAKSLDFTGDWGELLSKLDMARTWFASGRKEAPPKSIKIMTGAPIRGMYEFKLAGSNERLFFRYLSVRQEIVLIHHDSRGNIKPASRDRRLSPYMSDEHTILSIAPQPPVELRPMQRITSADLDIRLNPK